MQKIKIKYFIFCISILIFAGISPLITSLIRTTLRFDPNKNYFSRQTKYSYIILSSDEKILSKLSRKFEINNSDHKIPFLIEVSFSLVTWIIGTGFNECEVLGVSSILIAKSAFP